MLMVMFTQWILIVMINNHLLNYNIYALGGLVLIGYSAGLVNGYIECDKL